MNSDIASLFSLVGGQGQGGGGLMGIGNMLQSQRQAGNNAQMMKLQEDWQKLMMLYQIIQGIGSMGRTGQTSESGSQGGGVAGALGGMLGGAQVGNKLGQLFTNMQGAVGGENPW